MAFVSATSNTNTGTATPIGNLPANVVTGGILIGSVLFGGGTLNPDPTPPSGWTKIIRTDNGTNYGNTLYWKLATGSELSTYTWTFSGATTYVIEISFWTGYVQANPINASSGQANASSVNVVAPTLTTTVSGCTLIFLGSTTATASFTPPGTMTENNDTANTEIASEVLGAAGATGTRTAVASGAGVNIGQLLALAPISDVIIRKGYYLRALTVR